MNNEVLNTGEAAAHLGLAASTLEKLRVYGDGPAYFKVGRSVRYRPSDLDEWLDRHRIWSTSQASPGISGRPAR